MAVQFDPSRKRSFSLFLFIEEIQSILDSNLSNPWERISSNRFDNYEKYGGKKMKIKTFFGFILALSVMLSDIWSGSLAYARSIENIKKTGMIKIATRKDVPPFQFLNPDGSLAGIDPELGKMIADALGVKVEWEILKSPKFRSDVLLDKTVDLVISSFSVTKERLAVISFSEPYYTTGLAVMIRASDAGSIKSYKDLSGKRVSITKGSTGEKALVEFVPDAKIVYANDTPATYANLMNNNADAVINDKVFLDHYALTNQGVLVLEGAMTADQYGIGVNREYPDLLAFVNSFVSEIKTNGKLDAILQKHIGNSTKIEAVKQETQSFTTYIVQPNDTLSKLAIKYYGDATKWNVILASNQDKIKFANVLEVGWEIRVPEMKKASSE